MSVHKGWVIKAISKFMTLGSYIPLHRIYTSGVKISPAFKKSIFISWSGEYEKLILGKIVIMCLTMLEYVQICLNQSDFVLFCFTCPCCNPLSTWMCEDYFNVWRNMRLFSWWNYVIFFSSWKYLICFVLRINIFTSKISNLWGG